MDQFLVDWGGMILICILAAGWVAMIYNQWRYKKATDKVIGEAAKSITKATKEITRLHSLPQKLALIIVAQHTLCETLLTVGRQDDLGARAALAITLDMYRNDPDVKEIFEGTGIFKE